MRALEYVYGIMGILFFIFSVTNYPYTNVAYAGIALTLFGLAVIMNRLKQMER